MATRTVTVCDICGAILEASQRMSTGQIVVGSSYDGHRSEDDVVMLDLCPKHHRELEAVVDTVAGVNSHGSQRVFDRDTARAVLVLAVWHWGHALASIPVREEA